MNKIKLIFMALVVVLLTSTTPVNCSLDDNTRSVVKETRAAQTRNTENAMTNVQIPIIQYFNERKIVAKWAKHWDRPNLPTYVYLFSFGRTVGYYVADGKPISTQSYIQPEETYIDDPNGSIDAGSIVLSAPDIDGTYGTNNPGIRFFTASGIAVEWAGDGASYLYSDVPLKIDAPLLGK